MTKYLFAYHGGSSPSSPEEGAKVLQAWMAWFARMGDSVIDGGAPVGMSSTVQSDGSLVNNGGSNPVSGYSIIAASSLEDAHQKAKNCPILSAGGHIEIAAIHEM